MNRKEARALRIKAEHRRGIKENRMFDDMSVPFSALRRIMNMNTVCLEIEDVIRSARRDGVSETELPQKSRRFRMVSQATRNEIIFRLLNEYVIDMVGGDPNIFFSMSYAPSLSIGGSQ